MLSIDISKDGVVWEENEILPRQIKIQGKIYTHLYGVSRYKHGKGLDVVEVVHIDGMVFYLDDTYIDHNKKEYSLREILIKEGFLSSYKK